MKLRSFRLRVALLSVFLAGSALVSFSIASWLLISESKVARLDSELKNQLLKKGARPYWETDWQSYEASLSSELAATQTSLAVSVIGREGQEVYKSSNWPSQLNLTGLWPPSNFTAQELPLPPQTRPQPPPFLPLRGMPPEGNRGQPPERYSEEQSGEQPVAPQRQPEPILKVITQSTSSGAWRVGMVITPHTRMAITVSMQEIKREMGSVRNGFLISIPIALILVAVGAWLLSGSALYPIREVTASIRRVTAKGLDQRIAAGGIDVEFAELIQVFNQMMERLDRSFKQASRFSADAAHELKTPLAILQGELERTLQRVEPGSELQGNLSNLLDEVSRLGSIIRKLLLLSLADAGRMNLHKVDMNLSQVLADLAEDIEMLAPHLEVHTQIATGLQIKGDRDLLIQVLHNLISNAIKYNLPEGKVWINARYKGKNVFVTVTNTSHDIPASDRDRIFDRFHRGDPARSRQIEGLGLGLSLSREIARAHGGELKLDPATAGHTAFTLTLPLLPML